MSDPYYNLGLTDAEMTEIILLIDDEPVDEELLGSIRTKVSAKRKELRKRIRNGVYA